MAAPLVAVSVGSVCISSGFDGCRRESLPFPAAPFARLQVNSLSAPSQHAELIDGKAIAATIRQETADEVAELKASTGKVRRPALALIVRSVPLAVLRKVAIVTCADTMHPQVPGLAVVLVGSRKDSETYVRSKKKACAEVGIADFGVDLPEDATEQQVLEVRPWWASFDRQQPIVVLNSIAVRVPHLSCHNMHLVAPFPPADSRHACS